MPLALFILMAGDTISVHWINKLEEGMQDGTEDQESAL